MRGGNIVAVLLSLFLPIFAIAQESTKKGSIVDSLHKDNIYTSITDSNKLVIVFAGDIMGHDSQINGAYDDSLGIYNYEPTFRHISDYISSADIAVGNLEVTLAGPAYKGYPEFSSPDELAVAARDAGFDVFITANNHSLDRGAKGVDRTILVLDSLEIIHAGIYRDTVDREKRYPLIIEKKGVRLAILNYTYGTNGLKVRPPYIVNRIDTAQIKKDILKAKLANPDYIICTMHWGLEYQRTENAKQRALARFLISNGIDAIIGSHPHVIQPIKMDSVLQDSSSKKVPVVYSLGNFVSNQRAQYKDGGIVAELHLNIKDDKIVFDSICYLPYWVYREDLVSNKSTFYVVPVAKYENDSTLLNFSEKDIYKFNRFKTDSRNHLSKSKESVYYKR